MYVAGSIRVPGDKSLTHRALMLGALTEGESTIRGALTSGDARSTARVLRALGVGVSPLRVGRRVRIVARPQLRTPSRVLNCGNSGTTARLGLGLLAGHPVQATLTGDASLRQRPMRRVTLPLEAMGASFRFHGEDGLPLTVTGGTLRPIEWELPVSSAQLKSAILLAAVVSRVPVRVREPAGRSRDHTERLLRSFGFRVDEPGNGWIDFAPTGRLEPFDFTLPGDFSSAAFLLSAGVLARQGELRVEAVGVNPTRTGFLQVLRRMGALVQSDRVGERHGEPVADLIVRPARLSATLVSPEEVPGLIDEIPALAVLASRAQGTTTFHEVGELRVKESDRLELLASNLRRLGVEAEAARNTLHVTGTDRPPRGRVVTRGDHRLAMAFSVLGCLPGSQVVVDDPECAEVSFPGFARVLKAVVHTRP